MLELTSKSQSPGGDNIKELSEQTNKQTAGEHHGAWF